MNESVPFLPTVIVWERLAMVLLVMVLLYQWTWQYRFYRHELHRKSRRDRLACIPFFFFSALGFVKGWRLQIPVDYITWGTIVSLIVLNVAVGARLKDDFDIGPTPWQRKLSAYWRANSKRSS